jgi:hypothetical protein
MNRLIPCVVVLSVGVLSACSSDDGNKADGTGGAGAAGAVNGGETSASGKSSGGKSSGGQSSGGTAGSAAGAAGGGPTTRPGVMPEAMPLLSADAPAFASSSHASGSADAAKDRLPNSRWVATSLPAWLAYDLSAVPDDQRQQVLIAWYGGLANGFINPEPDPSRLLPIDYTLELNHSPGGTEPPADEWEVVATVTDNDRNSRQRLVDLAGANWVRIHVTKGAAADSIGIDMDVHFAPEGASDSWLLMGDSITFMSTTYLFSDLPDLVNARQGERFPAIIPAAIGGTNTTTALAAIEETLADYPGRFVGLAYGTNDQVADYKMEELIKHVIAAGKTPVVPHMPWSSAANIQEAGPQINQIIDDLYAKYPEILPGPDLWATFLDRTDLMPQGNVHPNTEGQQVLREAWAQIMAP